MYLNELIFFPFVVFVSEFLFFFFYFSFPVCFLNHNKKLNIPRRDIEEGKRKVDHELPLHFIIIKLEISLL